MLNEEFTLNKVQCDIKSKVHIFIEQNYVSIVYDEILSATIRCNLMSAIIVYRI